jgi:DNA helicase-2/ATP-dependent DNA helicase PcrA
MDKLNTLVNTVIFDMDGTIIDTEKYFRIAWPKALKHFGYELTDSQALELRSLGRPFAIDHFKHLFGEDFDYYKVRDYRKELMEELLAENGIEIKPGTEELLKYLKAAGYQTAIATASDLERTNRYLRQVGLIDYFDRLISAAMVEKGKPAPDIYLYACSELGRKPEECVAIEDSPNGVKSAYAAGCKVVMVPDQTEPDEELMKLIDIKINRLDELKAYL